MFHFTFTSNFYLSDVSKPYQMSPCQALSSKYRVVLSEEQREVYGEEDFDEPVIKNTPGAPGVIKNTPGALGVVKNYPRVLGDY